jgi:hypothetical protein
MTKPVSKAASWVALGRQVKVESGLAPDDQEDGEACLASLLLMSPSSSSWMMVRSWPVAVSADA